jgi:polysaccharide pyruvyl transferase WcaK-like protein
MNLIAPFGFFGAGNIGDESTLQGFARLVCHRGNGLHVWVASRDPRHTALVEPSFKYFSSRKGGLRRWWAQSRSSAEVIVGGTPIMDVLGKWPLSELIPLVSAAHDRQRPVVFVGSGIESLRTEASRRVISETLAPIVRCWTVRSKRDKDRLVEYGVAADRVTVAADLAWMLEAAPGDFGQRALTKLGLNLGDYLVGVNLTNERFVNDEAPRLFEKVAEFLDELVERRDARVLFFSNEVREGDTFDKAAGKKALALMKHQDRAVLIPNDYRTPQQTLSLIDCCDLTVSMRYHFCLFSALQGVPFIALKRSDKVDDLCWDMNWPYAVSVGDFSFTELLGMSSDIECKRKPLTESLQEQVQSMRKRALRNSVALDTLFRAVEE